VFFKRASFKHQKSKLSIKRARFKHQKSKLSIKRAESFGKAKMGFLCSEALWLQHGCKTRRRRRATSTTKTIVQGSHKLQAVNCFGVPLIMGLLMLLQIVVRTEEAQIGAGGSVMKLKHRMAEVEGGLNWGARQGGGGGGGGGMSVEHYKRLLSHDKARRKSLEVVDFPLYGHYLTDA
jgi:hypothetical protein